MQNCRPGRRHRRYRRLRCIEHKLHPDCQFLQGSAACGACALDRKNIISFKFNDSGDWHGRCSCPLTLPVNEDKVMQRTFTAGLSVSALAVVAIAAEPDPLPADATYRPLPT